MRERKSSVERFLRYALHVANSVSIDRYSSLAVSLWTVNALAKGTKARSACDWTINRLFSRLLDVISWRRSAGGGDGKRGTPLHIGVIAKVFLITCHRCRRPCRNRP